MTATIFLYALCSAITGVTALFAWRRRTERGLSALVGAMAALSLWGIGTVIEMTATDQTTKSILASLVNMAVAAAIIQMLFFVFQYFERDHLLTTRLRVAVWAPAIVYLGLSLTNPWHHWVWTDFRPGPPGSNITYYIHGPAYFLSVVYQLALAGGMVALLVREHASKDTIHRRRAAQVSASILASLFPYLTYLAWPETDLGFDLMPVGLALMGLLIAWSVFEELDRQMQARTLQLRSSIAHLENEITERMRAEEELHAVKDSLTLRVAEQSRNLSGIYELALLAGTIEDLPPLLHASLERMVVALAAGSACIHQHSASRGDLSLLAAYNFTPAQRASSTSLPGDWLSGEEFPRVFQDLSPAEAPSIDTEDALPAGLHLPGVASAIASPLVVADDFFGVLTVFWAQPGAVTVERIELFSALVKQVTLLVENIHLRRRIESAAAMRERRRLARDLHDSVTQSLHSLTIAAYTAGNRLRQGRTEQLDESLRQLSDGAAQALKEMRLLLFEMRLAPLESVDLVDALQTRLEAVEQRAGIDAAMILSSEPQWPKTWEREIYCIVMEALNNSLKHAHARQVRVQMGMNSGRFTLEIKDNGVGFNPLQTNDSGMGLHNMAERVERMGGHLHIDAAPGCGACIRVECDANPESVELLEAVVE